METFLTVLYVVVCLFLVTVVLIQPGKGGMGAGLGGAASQTVFGGAGAGNFLTKLTVLMAGAFMLLSATLAYLSSSSDKALERAVEEAEKAAAAGGAAGAGEESGAAAEGEESEEAEAPAESSESSNEATGTEALSEGASEGETGGEEAPTNAAEALDAGDDALKAAESGASEEASSCPRVRVRPVGMDGE